MDLISRPAIDVSTLALDGLSERNKALAANIANADTPGYQRTDVKFENQLAQIINTENFTQQQKETYSTGLSYSPTSVPTGATSGNLNKLLSVVNGTYGSSNQAGNLYSAYTPEVMNTNDPPLKADGNNVNIEYEMAELAKNGTKYAAISTLQEKSFRGLNDIITKIS